MLQQGLPKDENTGSEVSFEGHQRAAPSMVREVHQILWKTIFTRVNAFIYYHLLLFVFIFGNISTGRIAKN